MNYQPGKTSIRHWENARQGGWTLIVILIVMAIILVYYFANFGGGGLKYAWGPGD